MATVITPENIVYINNTKVWDSTSVVIIHTEFGLGLGNIQFNNIHDETIIRIVPSTCDALIFSNSCGIRFELHDSQRFIKGFFYHHSKTYFKYDGEKEMPITAKQKALYDKSIESSCFAGFTNIRFFYTDISVFFPFLVDILHEYTRAHLHNILNISEEDMGVFSDIHKMVISHCTFIESFNLPRVKQLLCYNCIFFENKLPIMPNVTTLHLSDIFDYYGVLHVIRRADKIVINKHLVNPTFTEIPLKLHSIVFEEGEVSEELQLQLEEINLPRFEKGEDLSINNPKLVRVTIGRYHRNDLFKESLNKRKSTLSYLKLLEEDKNPKAPGEKPHLDELRENVERSIKEKEITIISDLSEDRNVNKERKEEIIALKEELGMINELIEEGRKEQVRIENVKKVMCMKGSVIMEYLGIDPSKKLGGGSESDSNKTFKRKIRTRIGTLRNLYNRYMNKSKYIQ